MQPNERKPRRKLPETFSRLTIRVPERHVRESSSGGGDICAEVFERLVAEGEPAASDPGFRGELEAHFSRLPKRLWNHAKELSYQQSNWVTKLFGFSARAAKFDISYQVDLNADKAADVLIHQKVLALAKDPNRRPAYYVRFLKLEGIDNSDASEEGAGGGDALSTRLNILHTHLHEIIFSTVDKPKLLGQLSALLSDIGLNIREAHVFSTTDGYSLEVFVIDNWPLAGINGLHKELETSILRNKGSLCSSAAEKRLPFQAEGGDAEIHKKFLKMGEQIGHGAFGEVFHGTYFSKDVAVKVLGEMNEKRWKEFRQEIYILRQIHHTNVVPFIGACRKPPQYCIVTEYISGGSLYDFLHNQHSVLELPTLLKFALDVCRGMEYLHKKGIIHRDLKSANLLVDKDHVVKVADFGVARFVDQGGAMTAEAGTYKWMAPEVMQGEPYSCKADVFSFAIVLWELMTSKIPYGEKDPVQASFSVIFEGSRPELPQNAHPRLSDLMQRCWATEPSTRPSFSDTIPELLDFLAQVQGAQGGRSQLQKNVCRKRSLTL